MKLITLTCLSGILCMSFNAHAASAVDTLLQTYQAQGASSPSAQAGEKLWLQSFPGKGGERSCTHCHGQDLKQAGQHVKTKKTIQAMAPSVNPKRLSKEKKIKKWLKRNCKWTLGRECTSQEKTDLLNFLRSQ